MNRETFTQHIRQELSSLRRFLLAACSGNGNEADDVAQEALMKAYVASRRFEDEEGTIGIDKAHDVAGVSRSDDSFEYQELYQAIDGLTMSERTAVLLFYVEDRPIKEIATIMNVAEGTVKGYLSRGREHLRTKLSK